MIFVKINGDTEDTADGWLFIKTIARVISVPKYTSIKMCVNRS